MYDLLDIANYIIYDCLENNKDITWTQLNKILYLLLKNFYIKNKISLCHKSEDFKINKYGIYNEYVSSKYSYYFIRPIQEIEENIFNLNNNDEYILEDIINVEHQCFIEDFVEEFLIKTEHDLLKEISKDFPYYKIKNITVNEMIVTWDNFL